MKWSNEELTDIAEDVRINLKMAIDDLQGVEEYKEIYDYLEEALDVLNSKAEPFEEEYENECKKELEYENIEYEKSV